MTVTRSMMTYAKMASRWSHRTDPIATSAPRKMDADFGDIPDAGWSNGSSPGFNGSAAFLSAGSFIRRTSLASCKLPASSSSSNDFEIGSTQISIAAIASAWLRRNVFQGVDGGLHVFRHHRLRDFETSINSSPWIREAPQSEFSMLMRRINSRSSRSILGRPTLFRHFYRQKFRNPARSQ